MLSEGPNFEQMRNLANNQAAITSATTLGELFNAIPAAHKLVG